MVFWLSKLILGKNKYKLFLTVLSKKSFRYLREAIFLIKHPGNEDLLSISSGQKEPLLVDIGAFEGNFAELYRARNPESRLILVEPVPMFADKLRSKFEDEFTQIIQKALTADGRKLFLYLSDASTSAYSLPGSRELEVESVSIASLFQIIGPQKISLFQVNCEGGEYEIIPKIIEAGYINQIENLNIQFHYLSFENIMKHLSIRRQLSQTHKLVWSTYFIWERWEKKSSSDPLTGAIN